jgi:hypothetical protein
MNIKITYKTTLLTAKAWLVSRAKVSNLYMFKKIKSISEFLTCNQLSYLQSSKCNLLGEYFPMSKKRLPPFKTILQK